MNVNFWVDAFLHAIVLYLFLSLFYIYYITDLNVKVINKELNRNIQSTIETMKKSDKTLQNLEFPNIDPIIQSLNRPDPVAEANNKWLFKTIILTNIFLWSALIFVVVLMKYHCGDDIHFLHIVVENIVTFFFIGIVEYMFFTKVASQYIPVDPSFLPTRFVNSLINKFNGK